MYGQIKMSHSIHILRSELLIYQLQSVLLCKPYERRLGNLT